MMSRNATRQIVPFIRCYASQSQQNTNTNRSEKKSDPLIKRLVQVKRVSHTTTQGKKRQIYALVIVGDGNGNAGYGEGKSVESSRAIEKATLNAQNAMFNFERYEKRTLFTDLETKVCNSKVELFSANQGYGVVACATVHEVCRVFGLKDVGSKVSGSTNPMNVVKACFDALKGAQTPTELARMRGLKVEDIVGRYYGE